MSTQFARAVDATPVVGSDAARDALIPQPSLDQKVFRKDLGVQQRYNGSTWVLDSISYSSIVGAPDPDAFGYDSVASTGLSYAYRAGTAISAAGVAVRVNAGTLGLTNNAVNYVERTSVGVVSKNTTSFTAGSIPMAKVTTDTGAITTVEDWRAPFSPFALYAVLPAETGVLNSAYAPGDVRRYGGNGDGSSASAAGNVTALGNAMTAGVTVTCPIGIYLVDAEVAVPGDNVVLEGDNDQSSIIRVKSSALHSITLHAVNRTGLVIRNLQVDANYPNRTAATTALTVLRGVYLEGCTDCRLDNLTVSGAIGGTISGSPASGVAIGIGGNSVRVTVQNCRLISNGTSAHPADGVYMNCDQGLITDSVATNCKDTAFVLESCTHSGIVGCTAKGCNVGGAISVSTAADAIGNYINGLTIYDWDSAVVGGLQFGTYASTGNLLDTSVANVLIRRVTGTGPAVNVNKIGAGNTQRISFNNVRVYGASLQGMLLSGVVGGQVSNCAFINTDQACIQVNTGSSNVQITNCYVQPSASGLFGIATVSGVTNVTIQLCTIVGGGAMTHGIYHFGATSTGLIDAFNNITGAGVALIGFDAGSRPAVIGIDTAADGGLALGSTYKRFVNWSASGNGFTAGPDGDNVTFGALIKATGGYRHDLDGWTAASTPASQSNAALVRAAGNYVALRNGSATGISLRLSGAAVGGSATVTLYINGNPTALTAVIAAAGTYAAATAAINAISFVAGDVLDLRITTPGGWTSTTVLPYGMLEVAT